MLLKHLYDFAVSRKLLDDPAFRRDTSVRWIIHLDEKGNIISEGPQETEGPRRNKGHEYSVPKTNRATNSGTVADFLVDDIGAIFGLNAKLGELPKPKALEKLKAKNADFWQQILDAEIALSDPRFSALLSFRSKLDGKVPPFLRTDEEGQNWLVKSSSGLEKPLGDDLFSFTVSGSTPLFLHETVREHWRNVHASEIRKEAEGSETGFCLVTGSRNVPLARTHTPMVTGLPKPAKGTGAGIVGFESAAFRSYGLEKSYNSPTSISASKAYLLALQFLSKRDDHWLAIGQAWLCFWATQSESVTSLFSQLLNRPDTLSVRKFMTSPWVGIEKQPANNESFFAVTFTASGPRLVVKAWMQTTLDDAVDHFQKWFADLDLECPEKPNKKQSKKLVSADEDIGNQPLAIRRLAGCAAPFTVKAGKVVPDYGKLPSDICTQLYKSALEGVAPSISLLRPILNQLHSKLVREGSNQIFYDESRFALMKLILNRNRKEPTMEIKSELTADTDDPAYNCGRLLSVFNETQKKAHEYGLKGATVCEKFFGTASTSPAYVFPYLLKLNRHHLQKIGKSAKYAGSERFLEESISAILSRLGQTEEMRREKVPPAFPRTLDLQAQGRFSLGFYQQMAADAAARKASRNKSETLPESESN